jgi:uncharacterized protein DUF1501
LKLALGIHITEFIMSLEHHSACDCVSAACGGPPASEPFTRRGFLQRNAFGVGGIALAWMLQQERLLGAPPAKPTDVKFNDLKPRPSHFAAKATSMISLFMHGGPSHMDLLDPKPELTKRNGQDYQGNIEYSFTNRASKKLLGSPWKFAKHGKSGTEVSELLPHLAGIIDEVCVIRSMHTGINGHEPCIRYFQGGMPGVPGRPSIGSWMVYGLGSETQELPSYVVLSDPGGLPVDSANCWCSGFLPPVFQGTVLRSQEPRIVNLDPPAHLKGDLQQQNLALLDELNRRHLKLHPGEQDLEARIANYELAARMQSAAKDALDLSQETNATRRLYGLDQPHTREYGTRCLIARRLVERGVRFVQIFLHYQPWDHHSKLITDLPLMCRSTDQPSAALVADLKARGMLDSTIVHWGGEIGRLPVSEGNFDSQAGRDHNGQGFSIWLAGGGFRGGIAFGQTDEFGHKAVENVVTPNDYQATVLHQFGIDHEKLVYQFGGREQRLVDGRSARVVRELLS